ncbi:MAG: NCS2 family permease [Lachnospiraceae bacterium]|nr:NCS2 family permease [Lachnospiraceae bacterium]
MDFFNLKLHNTDLKTEIMSGITTFVSMAYILVVNPIILSRCGMEYDGVLVATVVSSVFTMLISAFYTKLPIAYAPGLSMNYYFVIIVNLEYGGSWKMALLATYLSGIIIIAAVCGGWYKKLLGIVPDGIKKAIIAGVGLGALRSGIHFTYIFDHSSSLERYNVFGISLTGQTIGLFTAFFAYVIVRKFYRKGALTISLLVAAIVGILLSVLKKHNIPTEMLEQMAAKAEFSLGAIRNNAFHFPHFSEVFQNIGTVHSLIISVFVMTVTHFFDANATITAVLRPVQQDDMNFDPSSIKKSVFVNGVGSIISGCAGTSSVTAYTESVVGTTAGGRTGVSTLVTALCFGVSLIFHDFFKKSESFVMAPALVVSGILITKIIREVDWHKRIEAVSAAYTFIAIGLSYDVGKSALNGIFLYIILNLLAGRKEELKPGWKVAFWIAIENLLVHVFIHL